MQRRDLILNLDKLNTTYEVNSAVTQCEVDDVSTKLEIFFPQKVLNFYSTYNGLSVNKMEFRLHPLRDLNFVTSTLVHFCSIGEVQLCFETKDINCAEQWDIVEAETGYIVTHTMASFLTMQMWKWLRHSREFWKEELFD